MVLHKSCENTRCSGWTVTLIGRYATGQSFYVSSLSLPLAIRFSVSANQHCRLKFLNHWNRNACQSSWSCLINNLIWLRKIFRAQSVEKASLWKVCIRWNSGSLSFSLAKAKSSLSSRVQSLCQLFREMLNPLILESQKVICAFVVFRV